MLFSSITFIFMFLPIVCVTYLLSYKNLRNYILLAASLVFYAWTEPHYLSIILFSIFVNYTGAYCISKSNKPHQRKLFLLITIIIDLELLFCFKYFNFAAEIINSALNANIGFIDMLLPIGISFYTFQSLSYVIDVYRKEVSPQYNIFNLALYICFFPQLVAGPIIKYHDIERQIDNRSENFNKVAYGVKRFIIGLAKKMLIADILGAVADKIFSQPVEQFDTLTAWIGAIAYSFQIFYDFAGYSDMAIGLGYIFGFKFLENFNYPYISKSITEFWRRWHISLSTWFKEYLYIPLGGNRVTKSRNYFNLLIVFLITGLWHGATWNFIVWGLWHGIFIIFEKITCWHKKEGNRCLKIAHHFYTILIVVVGWVIFRADTLPYAYSYVKNMFGLIKEHHISYEYAYYVDNVEKLAFVVALFLSMPIFSKILVTKYSSNLYHILVNIWLLFLFVLSVAKIAASTYSPFIYFRF